MRPYFYDITTITNFDRFTEPNAFDGEITIKFTCIEQTNKIVFHKADMNISLASIKVFSDLVQLYIVSTSYDIDTELFAVTLKETLTISQNYSISMNYSGVIGFENFGYFKSFYFDETGQKKYLKEFLKFFIIILYFCSIH